MAEKLKIQICSEIPTLNEDNDQEEKYILECKEKFKCNIWKCKKCHPNSPKLSKQEIIKINEQIKDKEKTQRMQWKMPILHKIRRNNQQIYH